MALNIFLKGNLILSRMKAKGKPTRRAEIAVPAPIKMVRVKMGRSRLSVNISR